MRTVVTVTIFAAMFLIVGWSCGERTGAQSKHLTEDQVIRIAEETAKAEGYDITKYNMTGCHYEYTKKDRSWTVLFSLKPPTPPGGHFGVWVDDQTKKARLMRGE